MDMRLQHVAAIGSAIIWFGTLTTDGLAQGRDRDREWVRLGCQEVSFGNRDRDSIVVGRSEGSFRAIRLAARGNDVEVLRLSVVYGNGNNDELDVRRVVRKGSHTAALDLRGRDRAIRRIEMVYRQRPDLQGRATVCAEGLLVS
jgi:hypothetical protein